MKRIQAKCALVTGASSGIGWQVARLLAKKKIEKMIICGRNVEALKKLSEVIQPCTQVEYFACDLAQREGQNKLCEVIRENAPDLVINNAGFGLYGETIKQKDDDIRGMIDVNITALSLASKEACRVLQEKKQPGVIVNISSAISFFPGPYLNVYAASKAFVTSFSEALDAEMEPYGIRVLAMCPGVVRTGFRKRAIGVVEKDPYAEITSMSSEFVAEEIWKQIEEGKRVQVIDFKTRMQIWVGRLLPNKFVTKFIGKAIQELNRPH